MNGPRSLRLFGRFIAVFFRAYYITMNDKLSCHKAVVSLLLPRLLSRIITKTFSFELPVFAFSLFFIFPLQSSDCLRRYCYAGRD